MTIYKYTYDIDKAAADKVKQSIRQLNKDIVATFKLFRSSSNYGTLKISFQNIGNLPDKLKAIQEVRKIIDMNESGVINRGIE